MLHIVLLMSSYVNAKTIHLIDLFVYLSGYKSEKQVPGELLRLYKEPQATQTLLGLWTGLEQHHLVP